jgi:uncharacterized protein
MDFFELTIKDKQLFDSYLKVHNPVISELTFTNLYMWRKLYNFKYTVLNGLLCIITDSGNEPPYALIPIGISDEDSFDKTVLSIKDYFNSKGWQTLFRKISTEELKLFKNKTGYSEDIEFDRNNSDYIYYTRDLITLGGKRFDGKRNHIKRFKREYSYEYIALTGELIDECHRIMTEWCAERKCRDHKNLFCEKIAVTELLNNYGKFPCKGALIKVDGRFEAFTIGERLNEDTAVIHVEKANSAKYGLYTFINQQFCENEWSDMEYINREQDMGVDGLRKSKLSYNPLRLVEKYTVRLKDR